MVRYNDDFIEDIKNSNDIVDVISQYVVLKRSGRNFFGLCPFHREKSPSFSVSPDKQIFHCFGCGVGGNVIHFISKIENIDFKESIELLAEKANIALPVLDNFQDNKKAMLKEKIYKINEKTAEFYHKNLYQTTSKIAQEYIKKRKLDNKTLKNFLIGYANNNKLFSYLKQEGFTEEEIIESSLINKYNNNYVERFNNRLIFPIKDIRNRVIAFGGRILDNSLPKYVNSPENIVYSKGRNLFGLNIAKNAKSDKIIIVEGYMDAISLHQRGITNVVASLGTALTEAQGRLLRKYAEKIIISYDSDAAGQAATLRGLEILDNLGCDVRILQMKDAKDPDEYIIKYGNIRFNNLVEEAISLIEFKAKVLKSNLNFEAVNDKIKFLNEVSKIIAKIESKIEQEVYIEKIAKEYNISKEAIYAQINKMNYTQNKGKEILSRTRPKTIQKNSEETDIIIKREEMLIFLLISEKTKMYNQVKDKVKTDDITQDINKRIIQKIYEEFEKNNMNNILEKFNDEETINALTGIMAKDYEITNIDKAIDNVLNGYKRAKLINRKNNIIEQLRNSNLDNNAVKELEEELQEIIIKLAKR